MVDEMGWWAIPIVSLVIFTLYGIEGIGSQLEDPFGYDRNDIKMDAIAGDSKVEIDVVLSEWRTHSKAMDALRHQPAGAYHGDLCLAPTRDAGSDDQRDDKYAPPDLFLRLRPNTGR